MSGIVPFSNDGAQSDRGRLQPRFAASWFDFRR